MTKVHLTRQPRWRWYHSLLVFWFSVAICLGIVVARNWGSIVWLSSVNNSVLLDAQYVWSLVIGVTNQFSILGISIGILFAVFFSINVILLLRLLLVQRSLSSMRSTWRGASHGVGGTVAALLGIGCATCGTAVLFTILSLFGATGLLIALPLGGQEFGLVGVALLAYSAWRLWRTLRAPMVCQ